MPDYLQFHFNKFFNPEPVDPYVQRSLDILNILIGEEETKQIKAMLRNNIDEFTNGDKSPPYIRIFRA